MIRAALVLLALTLATFGDVLGNIREQKLGTRTIAVNYTASTNRVLTAIDGGTTRNYTWDTRGPFETPPSAAPQDEDATGVAGQTFTYDLANQPTAVTGVATYAYDGNMKRVKEVRGGKTIYTIYSRVTGGLIYRDEATDAIKTDYVNVGGAALRLKKTGTGAPVAEYAHFDSQGSAVAGTNAAGTVAWRERYAPFGEELLNAAANNNNTGYTGHLKDDATGLTYMQARLQDPYSGRFLSTDPIGYQDQLNLYAYVANDPVNNVDPTGMARVEGNTCSRVGASSCSGSYGGSITMRDKSENESTFQITPGGKTYTVNHAAQGQGESAATDDPSGFKEQVETYAAVVTFPIGGPARAAGARGGSAVAKEIGILRDAMRGKGNFGLGSGTRANAEKLGRAWVGDGYKVASDGKTLVSSDGLRQFRPPSFKPNLGMEQANFERRLIPEGQWFGNGHLDIVP